MKKVIKLTLAVALLMGSTSLFAQKFGRIDTREVITSMPEAKMMQLALETFVKDLDETAQSIQVELQNKFQEYQKNSETMTPSVRGLKEKELEDLQVRRDQFQQTAQEDYTKKQNELLQPIIAKAKEAIDKVSAAGGYIAIFDTSTGSLAYFDEATLIDISPEVKKILGVTATPAATPTPAPAK